MQSARLDERAGGDHLLVFVGGLHRSGTTLLTRCLSEHPQVSAFSNTGVPADEGQHLQTVYPQARAYGGPGRFAFADAAHMTEASPLASPERAWQLFQEWAPHWDLAKRALVEKSPPNLIRTRFLQALFPAAAFVVITRHPIAVALATQKWSQTSIAMLLRHWIVAHTTFEEDRPHLARVMVVSYEHLIARTQECLDGVYAFLELPGHASRLEARADGNEAYFARWRSLSRLHRRLLERRFGRDVARFGYRLADADVSLRF